MKIEPVGPPIQLDSAVEEDLTDAFLIRPDRAVVSTVERGESTSDPTTFRFYVVNPLTGAVIKKSAATIPVNTGVPPSFFKIDDNTVGFAHFYYASAFAGLTYQFMVGTVSADGTVRYRNHDWPHQDFTQIKEPNYSCWDPVQRVLTLAAWTKYQQFPSSENECWAFTVNYDTLAIEREWRVYAAQSQQFYTYYEHFATSFPGYGGALGFELAVDELGRGLFNDHDDVWIVDNAHRKLLKLPKQKPWFGEGWFSQVADDPNIVAIYWQEFAEAANPADVVGNTSNTQVIYARLYPSFKVLRGPVLVGTYPDRTRQGYLHYGTAFQNWWSFNLYDQPRYLTQKYATSFTYSSFGRDAFGDMEGPHAGPLIGIKSMSEPADSWTTYAVPLGGLRTEPVLYSDAFTWGHVSGDSLFLGGEIFGDTDVGRRKTLTWCRLFKLTPRGVGTGNHQPRSVNFT